MNYPSVFVFSLLLFTAFATPVHAESKDLKSNSFATPTDEMLTNESLFFLDLNVAKFSNKEQRLSSPTQAINPESPRFRRRRGHRSFLTKGFDFTVAYGFNYFKDSYEFRSETAFSDALTTSFTPAVGRAFSAKLEIPVGQYFRLGTGVDILSQKRNFTAPENSYAGIQISSIQRRQTVQLPVYMAFDQRIRQFSVGVGVGVALQVFQHTSGAVLLEDLTIADAETTAGGGYYNDALFFRGFAEFRGEYRPSEKIGVVARVGYQISGPNELNKNNTTGVLRAPSVQVKVGVNYVLFCDGRRR